MKKLKQIALLFTGIALVTISSCKKYPDGPLLSLHSKEKRIAGSDYKTWDVVYYSINGLDSTSYLQAQPYYGKFGFYSKNAKDPNYFYTSGCGTSGKWKLTNNKKDLYIYQRQRCTSVPQFNMTPYFADEVTWEIRRLTDDDLWLKTTYNSKEYLMKLKH
jgi:hypothetical protein